MWSSSSFKYNCISPHFGKKEKLVLLWHASHWIRKVAPIINLIPGNFVCSLFNKCELSLYQEWGIGSVQKFWSRCSSPWSWYFSFSASFHNLTTTPIYSLTLPSFWNLRNLIRHLLSFLLKAFALWLVQ